MDLTIDIRRFEAADLDACYAISLATGLAGGDASHLYIDPRLMGHIYVAPYALLEPTLVLVVEDGDGVAGFVAGATDTETWEHRLERDWWPPLRSRYPDPSDVPREMQTPDQRRAFMIHHPLPTPAAITTTFPAHLHVNILPRLQRRGVGSKLLDSWRQAAGDRGARSMHVGVNRANEGAIRFWRARGFEAIGLEATALGRTLWMGFEGQ
jgi:ribosomal protein S18 acetylase RimI-like enzyme